MPHWNHSQKMTVSAPVRLIPTPPDRVDRMKQKVRASLLKRCRQGERGGNMRRNEQTKDSQLQMAATI